MVDPLRRGEQGFLAAGRERDGGDRGPEEGRFRAVRKCPIDTLQSQQTTVGADQTVNFVGRLVDGVALDGLGSVSSDGEVDDGPSLLQQKGPPPPPTRLRGCASGG